MIRHIVFFTLKTPSEKADAISKLERLGAIPGSTLFQVRANTKSDQIGNDVDVVVYAEFPSIEALKRYKQHPVYADVTRTVRPMRALRFAADIEV